MSRWKGVRSRLRSVLRRGESEQRMDEEMLFHLEMETRKHETSGLPRAEARRRALVAFGGEDRHRELMRDDRGLRVLEDLGQDLRYAWRSMLRARGFSVVAVLTIALGIGATTSLFSVTNALLLKDLPVADQDELYSINERRSGAVSSGVDGMNLPHERYRAYAEALSGTFAQVAAHRYGSFALGLKDGAIAVGGSVVSGNYFAGLGLVPAAGRLISSDDEPVVVLSHRLWQSRFGGSPSVVGSTVQLDGRPYTVAGIAPRRFAGLTHGIALDVWVPHGAYFAGPGASWNSAWVALFGRVRPGVAPAAAAAAVDGAARAIPPNEQHTTVRGASLDPVTGLPAQARSGMMAFVGILMGTAALVLLIASANIAGMLMARAIARRREIAVRLAIGAGRGRLIRQLLTESVVLFLLGAAGGIAIAEWATRLLANIRLPVAVSIAFDASPDLTVLGFAIGMAALTGIIFGLAPALQASRQDLTTSLKSGATQTPGRARLRSAFVTGQLALAVLLLVVAGLFVRSLREGLQVDLGFDPENTVIAALNVAPHGYSEERGRAFYDALVARVRALPGVHAVALAERALVGGNRSSNDVTSPDAPQRPTVNAGLNVVDGAYFDAVRMQLIAGRSFGAPDRPDATRTIVINEELARHFWPGESPLGKRVHEGGVDHEVIGVVRNGKYVMVGEQPLPFIFLPFSQQYSADITLHVRSALPPAAMLAQIRREVAALDPALALTTAMPLTEYVGFSLMPQRVAAVLVLVFGVVGLLLGIVGIYGVVAFHVAQRTYEFGIRMALGAHARDVLRLVLARGTTLGVAGVLTGLILAAAATRLLRSFLFGVSPLDPITFVTVAVLLLLVALLASWIPARRATRVTPMVAFRTE